MAQYYKTQGLIDVAAHPTLDRSVPPIAISSFDFQDPYTPMAANLSQVTRATRPALRCVLVCAHKTLHKRQVHFQSLD